MDILIVEDHDGIAEATATVLRRHAHHTRRVRQEPRRSTRAQATSCCSTLGFPTWTAWKSSGGCANVA